jgi:Exostosin family
MQLNLIWSLTPQSLAEADWIHWLFQDFEIVDHVAPGWDLFQDNSIYILSDPLSRLPGWFLEGIRGVRGKGLFHLSDESFRGGNEIYTNFDFVLRNYHSTIFKNPGIMTLPLGFTNNMMSLSQTRPATERRFLWSFAGFTRASRIDMFKNFKNVRPHKCYLFDSQSQEPQPWLDRAEFRALLSDSVFTPCPMGNTVLESFRIYESLEMGCIPIVESRRWMPYYDRLMPGHALPTFSSWRKARQFVEALSSDQSRMIAYQQDIAEWWRSYKVKLRSDVTSFVSLGLEGSFRSSLSRDWHCRKGVNHQVWRLFELLKHASPASLQERIGITTKRLISRARLPSGSG